jgi:predicted phage terminase large subunit-like protein
MAEKWHQLCLKALDNGRALWPYKHDVAALEELRRKNPYVFSGQYQQEPTPLGGGIFKAEWVKLYRVAPNFEYKILTGDTAQKTKEHHDFTVFQCWGLKAREIYLVDQVRGKWEAPELLTIARAFWNKHNNQSATTGRLRNFYIEDKASGTGLIQTLRRVEKIPVKAIQRAIDKVTRAMDAAPYFEGGFVHLPESAPWLSDYVRELTEFTPDDNHEHDDQIDATMDAIEILLAPAKATGGAF